MASDQTTVAASSRWSLREHPFRTEIRFLFLSAMAVFVITVAIGLLNGQKVVNLSQDVLLTHVHAGTLGWITLNAFAVGLWTFGEGVAVGKRNGYVYGISLLAAISFPVYVLAFLSGNAIARAIFGLPVLLAIICLFIWIAARTARVKVGVTHLALLGALFTLVVGSINGVLLQIQFVTAEQFKQGFLPNSASATHPAIQVVGYLILLGMALCEWRLMTVSNKISIAGIIQISLPFIAGFVLTAALLLNVTPLFGLNALLEVVAVVIFVVRFLPRVISINWAGRANERFLAFSALFLVVNVALLVWLIALLVSGMIADPTQAPGILLASDHSMFIGVITNALFAMIAGATAQRRSFWSWADDVLLWGMNLGLVGFLVGLILQLPILERIFTPIMGLSILLGLLVYALRARGSGAEAEASASAGQGNVKTTN